MRTPSNSAIRSNCVNGNATESVKRRAYSNLRKVYEDMIRDEYQEARGSLHHIHGVISFSKEETSDVKKASPLLEYIHKIKIDQLSYRLVSCDKMASY